MEHNKQTMHNGHNDSIGCLVTECKYHCNKENYCTLQQIKITKHSTVASTPESTDCGSFEKTE